STLRTACPMPNLAMVASPSVPDAMGSGRMLVETRGSCQRSRSAARMLAQSGRRFPGVLAELDPQAPLIPAQAGIQEELARVGLWLWVPLSRRRADIGGD